jgi:hypothetical protein
VYTNGYFDFENGVNLQSEKVEYVPLSKEDQGYHRPYIQGNLLSVTIHSLDGEFEHADRLAFTLCYLLNELFVSLYPHNHSCISVCTALSESFYKGHDPLRDRYSKYLPRLRTALSEGNDSQELRLYVFEDSSHSLGLIDSVVQHWEHFLEILDDYLSWSFDANPAGLAVNQPYILPGSAQSPKFFSFESVAAYLRRWLPDNTLRSTRVQYLNKAPDSDSSQVSSSAVSSSAASSSDRSSRPDLQAAASRRIVNINYSSSITPTDEIILIMDDLQEVYGQIRNVLASRMNLEVRGVLQFSLVPAKELQQLTGIPIVPMTERPRRICGQAIRTDQGAIHFYLAIATSKVDAIATLAHELTHVWQYRHLQMEVIPQEKLEGHAMWVEISVLESLGYLKEAEQRREGLINRSDVYGRGFRSLLNKLEEDTLISDPFIMMLSIYGRVAV